MCLRICLLWSIVLVLTRCQQPFFNRQPIDTMTNKQISDQLDTNHDQLIYLINLREEIGADPDLGGVNSPRIPVIQAEINALHEDNERLTNQIDWSNTQTLGVIPV